MKAAVVMEAGKTPVYGDFETPVAKAGEELITVRAGALSNLTRMRASGSHYSSSGVFPAVAGTDGVGLTQDGRRVYFAMPEAPFGSLAEFCPIHPRRCVGIPDSLDDYMAAAIANPGMSAWAALMERARLAGGETVLVNGATGTAGRIAVQLAKYLGAARVIATGRNEEELEEIKQLGADVVISFNLSAQNSSGARDYEDALKQVFAPRLETGTESGVDVVIDYLWGESAKSVIAAIATTAGDRPVRFVQVGAVGGETIELPGAALRSSAITLMGSGVGSVSGAALLQSIRKVFESVGPAGLKIASRVVPISDVEDAWSKATGKPRVVFSIG